MSKSTLTWRTWTPPRSHAQVCEAASFIVTGSRSKHFMGCESKERQFKWVQRLKPVDLVHRCSTRSHSLPSSLRHFEIMTENSNFPQCARRKQEVRPKEPECDAFFCARWLRFKPPGGETTQHDTPVAKTLLYSPSPVGHTLPPQRGAAARAHYGLFSLRLMARVQLQYEAGETSEQPHQATRKKQSRRPVERRVSL